MGVRMHFDRKEIVRTKILEPERWYHFRFTGITKKPAADKSTNYWMEFTGVEGEAQDVVVPRCINEKALSMALPYLRVLGADIPEEPSEDGLDVDFEPLFGNDIDLYIIRGAGQDGSARNEIGKFRSHQVD